MITLTTTTNYLFNYIGSCIISLSLYADINIELKPEKAWDTSQKKIEMVCSLEKDMRADEAINKCDAAHEKVPNG